MTDTPDGPRPQWAEPSDLTEVADFVSHSISADPRYISHGEIQYGLSRDGTTWVANLAGLMREDIEASDPDQRVAILRDIAGTLLGAAIVATVRTPRVSYIVIEDIVVSSDARSGGVGRTLVAFIEDDARSSGVEWAFLESGLHNERAHAFFERQSYRPLSKVFGKPLQAKP